MDFSSYCCTNQRIKGEIGQLVHFYVCWPFMFYCIEISSLDFGGVDYHSDTFADLLMSR